MKRKIRHITRFQPYIPILANNELVFELIIYNLPEKSKHHLGYKLTMIENKHRTILFNKNDYYNPNIKSGRIGRWALIEHIMYSLTLRPGNIYDEYFKDYSSEQLEYCVLHGECLYNEVLKVITEKLGNKS